MGAVALSLGLPSMGCVERYIHELDKVADGGEGSVTETLGPGDTEQVPPDPDAECSIPRDCDVGQTCFEGVCVGMGAVRVSLSWTVVTDLDLHLWMPNGETINYESPVSPFGQLDVDDCVSATCINQNGTHVENIFLDASAPRGTYRVHVTNFDGRLAADYRIEVAGAVSGAFVGSLPQMMFVQGPIHEFTW